MSKAIPLLTYSWSVIIGAIMLVFGPGGLHVVCIACGPASLNLAGVVSMVLGLAGLATLRAPSAIGKAQSL